MMQTFTIMEQLSVDVGRLFAANVGFFFFY